MAIPLLLFKADLRRILREAGPTLLAFLAGGVGTVLGTLVAFRLVPLGEQGFKLAGIFCATYVGGSVNYVATSEALDLRSGDLLTAGIAADNLVMTLCGVREYASAEAPDFLDVERNDPFRVWKPHRPRGGPLRLARRHRLAGRRSRGPSTSRGRRG